MAVEGLIFSKEEGMPPSLSTAPRDLMRLLRR